MTDSMDCLKRCKESSSGLSSLIAAGGIRTAAVSLFVITALPVMGKDLEVLSPGSREKPNDTSGMAMMEIAEAKGFAGKRLKVTYGRGGGSFGQSQRTPADWTKAETLSFRVYHPGKAMASITLTVKHESGKGYGGRIDRKLNLRPSDNRISINLKELRNNNGSAPDLSSVRHWYLAGSGLTLYFGNFKLTGQRLNSTALPARPKSPGRSVRELAKPGMSLPKITEPILFNTLKADAVMAALQVFPENNPWNEDVSGYPVHPNSRKMIETAEPNRHLYFNRDMSFVIVPPSQPKVDVKIVGYPGESDPGPFPVPSNAPVEGWPFNGLDLGDHQRNGRGDRHVIVLDPRNGRLHEFFATKRTNAGWQAAQASTFDLATNKLRPDGWTSADAAGLPILPAVIRYDDLKSGMVGHAMRVTLRKTRRAYVYPATHFASRLTDPNLPRMGERLRLRADFDLSGFPPQAQAVLKGLKKFGMLVADNGVNWCLSVAPDKRIKGLEELTRVKGRDFEVVVAPGPNAGPRPK